MAHFKAATDSRGALIVGSPKTVANKIAFYDTVLGGILRLTFQMSVAGLPHERALRATELLGNRVIPVVNS